MQELALILNRKRVRRGSIDFDLPEPLIEFDELGAMTGVTRAPRNIAHRLIEEFMLAANESRGRAPGAARASPPSTASTRCPTRKRVMEFEEIAAHFGYSLGIGAMPVKTLRHRPTSAATAARTASDVVRGRRAACASRSRHYQKLVAKIEGKPEERILSYLMLRSLKQARYSDGERRPLRAGRADATRTSPRPSAAIPT